MGSQFNGVSFHDVNAVDKAPVDCLVCGESFTPNSGAQKYCSPQCKGKMQYISGRASTENQYKEISGNWSRYVSRLIYSGGKKREHLTAAMLLEMLEEQEYRCAISGVELTCILQKGTKSPTNVSIDRIEAGGPYIRENVQLVCNAVNKWRGDTPLSEFIWWCKQITEYQE